MDESLYKAVDEAREPRSDVEPVLHEHTDRSRSVSELMERLRGLASNAMKGEFFDEGVEAEVLPTRSMMRSEAGTVRVHARRREPAYRVSLQFDVRTDSDGHPGAANYEVHGTGTVWCESSPRRPATFHVVPALSEDGSLDVDAEKLRDEIAAGIRAFGKP